MRFVLADTDFEISGEEVNKTTITMIKIGNNRILQPALLFAYGSRLIVTCHNNIRLVSN